MVKNWKGILLRGNSECKNPYGHQVQKQKAKLSHSFSRAWLCVSVTNKAAYWERTLPASIIFLHSVGPGSIVATTLAHMYWANDVSEGRTAPQTKGCLPPRALGFKRAAGEEYGIQQVFHNSPIGSAWLGKGPGAGRYFRLVFQQECGSFASFNRSSVGSVSSSTSDFELAQMHCADGAVTLTGLELIKNWNILDQEEDMGPDV